MEERLWEGISYQKIGDGDIAQAKALVREYVEWVGRDLGFQDIDGELAGFPKKYEEPEGCFIVAKDGGRVVGSIAMRKLGEGVCELKRMFVRESHRGRGIGRALLELAIGDGRAKGYGIMRLDTMNSFGRALDVYRRNGFYEIEPYYDNPYEGALYMERIL